MYQDEGPYFEKNTPEKLSQYIIALDDDLFEVRITKFRINFYFSEESMYL
jgi:hypothetical protein